MFPVLAMNTLIGVLLSPFCVMAYEWASVHTEWPGTLRVLLDLLLMAAAYDTWFYVVHRLMHTKWLCVSPRLVCSVICALGWDDYGGGQPSFRYGRSHKLHHTWKAPVVRGQTSVAEWCAPSRPDLC